MRHLLLYIVLSLSGFVHAQWNWPVQVNAVTTGPYYNYLSYYADQNNHLQVMVTLTDLNAASVPAKLHVRVEGPGYWIETKSFNNIAPFTLEPFAPNIFSGYELAPYFNESNLVKSSPNLNLNNLPEGLTTVCIEVLGVGGTLTTIGGNQCAPFWLQKFQPPQATLPICDSELDTNQLFHTFQWSPPVGYVPMPGSELNYTFSLYEWTDPTNYSIFQTGQGLVYETNTPFTTLQISDFDLQLQHGMSYVWRIQASLSNNGAPVYMFENNGLSEICVFTYGSAQSLEEFMTDGLYIDLSAESSTPYKGRAFWTVIDNTPGQGLSNYDRFWLEYRKKPTTPAEENTMIWHGDTVVNFSRFIYQLGPEVTYQVRISGIVGSYVDESTNPVEFTTPEAREYACGDQQMPYSGPTIVPNNDVVVGDEVQIGQFRMKLYEANASGGAGHYSGNGTIPIAFLGGAQVNVVFDDILIDKEYVVREGRVDVTTTGVDAWIDAHHQDAVDPIYVGGTVESAGADTTDGVAWVVVDGDTLVFEFNPPGSPVIINDESGYQYVIWPNGEVTVNVYLTYSNDHLDVTANDAAVFVQSDAEVFGFDAKEHMQWHANYEIILLSDSSHYFVANKSVGQDESDVVGVTLPSGVSNPQFLLDDQQELSASSQQGLSEVTIPAISQTGIHTLYVYNGTSRIGKLNVHVYAPKERKVVVVPIANASVDLGQLQAALNQTLGEAKLTFDITLENQWNDAEFTPTRAIVLPAEVGVLNKYSPDMKALRDAYFDDSSTVVHEDSYYLFVVPGFDDSSVDGYMVRGRALGFVAAGSSYRTYAHELAHGMGGLPHSWNEGPAQGSTSNLMDYNGGLNLIKVQWEELRDVDLVPGIFDEGEDFASMGVAISALEPFRDPTDSTFTFFRVNGRYITLPPDITSVTFSTLDRFYTQLENEETSYTAPVGSMIAFSLDGKTYSTNLFGSYVDLNNGNGGANFIDTLTNFKQPTKGITSIFYPGLETMHQYFFEINSPINQTEYTGPSAIALDKVILFESSTNNRGQLIEQYVDNYRIGNKLSINVNPSNLKFGNGNSPIIISDGPLGVNLNTFQAFNMVIDQFSTVENWIKYLSIVNAKSIDFETYSECVGSNTTGIVDSINQASTFSVGLNDLQLNLQNTLFTYASTGEQLAFASEQFRTQVLTEALQNASGDMGNLAAQLQAELNSGAPSVSFIETLIRTSPDCALYALENDLRIEVLALLAKDEMLGNHFIWFGDANTGTEEAGVRLIKYVLESNIDDFLPQLNIQRTIGGTNTTLLERLIYRIDGNNYDELVSALITHYDGHYRRLDNQAPFITNHGGRLDDIDNCQLPGARYFSDITILQNGTISLTYEDYNGCYAPDPWTIQSPVYKTSKWTNSKTKILSLDAPILLQYSGNISGIKAYGDQNVTGVLLPAFFLKYIDHLETRETVQNRINAIAVAIDIATVLTGPGAIIKAYRALKYGQVVLRTMDMSVAGMNLSANVSDAIPDDVLISFNVIAGAYQLAAGFRNAVRNMDDVVANIDNIQVRQITEAEARAFVDAIDEGNYADLLKGPGATDAERAMYETYKYLKAELGTSWVEGVLGSIIRNGNKIEYTNPAGKLLKWSEQSVSDITNSINAAKNSGDIGRVTEANVAEFLQLEGKSIEGFGVKIKNANNQDVTDIDLMTQKEIVEVKNSYSSWSSKPEQVNRLVNSSLDDFINPYNKKAILYIETPLTQVQKTNILNTIPSNVTLVNSPNALKTVIQ